MDKEAPPVPGETGQENKTVWNLLSDSHTISEETEKRKLRLRVKKGFVDLRAFRCFCRGIRCQDYLTLLKTAGILLSKKPPVSSN